MNKTEESDKRWEGGGKICLKAYQKSGVTVILFTVRGCSKLKRPIESSTAGAGFACPNQRLPPEKLQIVADKYKN